MVRYGVLGGVIEGRGGRIRGRGRMESGGWDERGGMKGGGMKGGDREVSVMLFGGYCFKFFSILLYACIYIYICFFGRVSR